MAVVGAFAAGLLLVGVYPEAKTQIEVSYVYSPDIAELVEPQISAFNDAGLVIGGRRVHVTGDQVSSGDARNLIKTGGLSADAWTPAASVWGSLLDTDVGGVETQPEVASLVSSPQVIAMWRDCAKELNWSDQAQPSWKQVFELARTSGEGTVNCVGFTLGGTDPNKSTSGLLAVASWYQVETGRWPLTVSQLSRDESARRAVYDIEHGVAKYWDTSVNAMDDVCANKPPYVDGIYLQENTVVTKNDDPTCQWQANPEGMVAVYPRGGTFAADYPFYSVTRPDSAPQEVEAATQFGAWLAAHLTPETVDSFGFRTADGTTGAQVSEQYGALPSWPKPQQILAMPTRPVAEWLQQAWRDDCGKGDPCGQPS
jgi:hypothetical protein